MRLRLVFATLVFLLSARAFGYDANWWYDKYQKFGQTDPKWDSLVREGIDHWQASVDANTDSYPHRLDAAELALSVKALEKAYGAGCRCPIVLFIDARNTSLLDGGVTMMDRFHEVFKQTEKRPDLAFVRIRCANALGWRTLAGTQFKEAIPYFEMALSLSSPDVEENIFKEARAGLQQAKEKVAVNQKRSGQLAALTLPSNPTKEQARAYVREILFLVGNSNKQGGTSDVPSGMLDRVGPGHLDLVYPEVAMLEKVGPENLDVLVEIWGISDGPQSWWVDHFVKAALERLARPEDKALLLKWLPLHEEIVDVMQQKGWIQDMRPFLLARIAEHATDTNVIILKAAAALRDPAAYNDLIWHFENNMNGPTICDDIKNLPGIQLKDAVVRMWAESKSWTDWRSEWRYSLACAAMDYGVTDALEFAVENLDSPLAAQRWRVPETLRAAILQRTGLRGSDDDIRAWF